MLGPTQINAVFDSMVDEQISRGNTPIKIRCQEICERLGATNDRDILSVYEVISTRIYMLPNNGSHIDHDVPEHEMERARVCFEKNNPNIGTGVFDSNKKNGCFIATATYDSYNSPEVLFLRKWRDDILLKSTTGRLLIKFYYKISPHIAKIIKKSLFLKNTSRLFLNIFIKIIKNK